MKVSVKTAGYRGVVTKTVALTSDDPGRPNVTLRVKMAIVGSVELMPANRIILRFLPEQPTVGSLLLRRDPTETGDMNLAGVTSDQDWLKAAVRPAEPGEEVARGFNALEGDFVLEVEAVERPGAGVHHAKVRFSTGLPREPTVTVPVTLSVRAFGLSRIRTLDLRRKEPGGLLAGRLQFRLLGNTDPEAVQVEVTPADYQVEVLSAVQGKLFVEVRESPAPGREGPPPEGTLTFRYGSETVKVPVRPSAP